MDIGSDIAVIVGAVVGLLLIGSWGRIKISPELSDQVERLDLHIPPLADRLAQAEGLLAAKNQSLRQIPVLEEGRLFDLIHWWPSRPPAARRADPHARSIRE